MQDFRILGTLEVIGESGPVTLGGPRPRALLAALLLRAGHVVPTEQLVDELYGAEPPKFATASLQNSVAALRKALGPDLLVTRAPGYLLAVPPEQIDARRFELLLTDARDCPPAERRTLLLRGLALWRGPPLAEFAFEAWAETEARRLDDLRLVAVEERIAADIDLDGQPMSCPSSTRSPASTRFASVSASCTCSPCIARAGRRTHWLRTPRSARRSPSSV